MKITKSKPLALQFVVSANAIVNAAKFLTLSFLLCLSLQGFAQLTWTSRQTGPWISASTWNTSGGATGAPPTELISNQRVIITNGDAVTVGGGANSILMDGNASLTINAGGKLVMGDASFPAPSLTMKNVNSRFTIIDGTYQSYAGGSGSNLDVERGVITWYHSSLYVSGNCTFYSDAFIDLDDVCLRTAQNQKYQGIGSPTNVSRMRDVYNICGTSGTGSFAIEDNSYVTLENLRIVVGSTGGSAKFTHSNISGSIYTLYGNQGIDAYGNTGKVNLTYVCANLYNYGTFFTGSRIINCPMAITQICTVGDFYGISGTIRNDADGGLISGSPITKIDPKDLFVSLLNVNNVILQTKKVANDGTYSFNNLLSANYKVVLHTKTGGSSSPDLPSSWLHMAEGLTSSGDGTPNGIITPIILNTVSDTTADFGIQASPNSKNKFHPISPPNVGQVLVLSGVGANPPLVSGDDFEDCNAGCDLNGKKLQIDQVPSNTELYYNSALLTSGSVISNFNPNVFTLKITNATLGTMSTDFQYSFIDAADVKDPTPATYKISWEQVLPITGLEVSAKLEGNNSLIKWVTETEIDSRYFVVERSLDNRDYSEIGRVTAGGNTVNRNEYSFTDMLVSQVGTIIYYRLRLVDKDAKSKFSNVVFIRRDNVKEIGTWPNPFKSNISLTINTEQSTTVNVKIADLSGRTVYSQVRQVIKGSNQVTIQGLDKLSSGIFMMTVEDSEGRFKYTQKLVKQ